MRFLLVLLPLAMVGGCAAAEPSGTPDGGVEVQDAGSVEAGGRDAGLRPDASTQPACDEHATADALEDPRGVDNGCVFDLWAAALPKLDAAAQRARVKRWLETADLGSRAPVRSGDRVIFIADASQGNLQRLAGSFNGWDPGRGEMKPLFETGYAWREETLGPGRYAYKFVYLWKTPNESWVPDPAARWIEPDGVTTSGVGTFNSVLLTEGAPVDRGLLRLVPRVRSPQLGNERDLYVYLPRSTFTAGARFPSLYVHDGNEMLSRSRMDLVADSTFSAGRARPAVLVFIPLHDQNERMAEYTFGESWSKGDSYRAFVADTLVPLVDASFPTYDDPKLRGVAGASLGGLISSYIAWGRSERFGLVGSQSGSYFWREPGDETLTRMIREAPGVKPIRFYVDNGTPGDNDRVNANLVEVLADRGYTHTHVVDPEGRHDWADWARRWPGMLGYLFAP